MRRCLTLALLTVLFAGGAAPREGFAAEADRELREAALAAITRAQQFLAGKQLADGSWPHEGHPVGVTALVVLSLLYSGQTVQEPTVQRGVEFIVRSEIPDSTYDVSLMAMALALADPQRHRGKLEALKNWLVAAQLKEGSPSPGAWWYHRDEQGGWDNSNTQFALLGLRECAHAGIEVPREVWLRAQQHFLRNRAGSIDGGGSVTFGYSGRGDARGSMQVAGISSLMITSSMLDDDRDVTSGQIDCCASRDDEVHRTIEAAFRWLGQRGTFTVQANPAAGASWYLYYLYGLERAGRFTGRRFIGEHDWYRLGVRHLISLQNPRDGSWFRPNSSEQPLVGTAFALMFLAKGNSPVLINKLKYGDPQGSHYGRGWNRHPRDAANLCDHVATRPRWPRLLSWQVVDLPLAAQQQDGAALLQAKVQLLTGDGPLALLSDDEVRLLREYIDQGGFLLAVNTCGGAEFEQGVHDLVRRMFPEGDHKLELLPDTHDVYRSEHVLTAAEGVPVPPLWGVDVGCRTAILYSPEDLCCRWNKWMPRDPPRRDLAVRLQIKRAMDLGVNIVAYATGRELLDALTEPQLLARPDPNASRRGKLEIARLRHTGGWDTAPAALRHLQAALNNVGISTAADAPNVAATDPLLFDYPLVYMHGRRNFQLTEPEQTQLKSYLDNGGFLLADACCGAPQFDESFRTLVRQMFNKELEAIPIDHPLFQSPLGFDIRSVRRRLPLAAAPGAPLQSEYSLGPPVLEGITDQRGRYVLVYSKYDLSCALQRQATVNCAGYASDDAARIATNLVIYALSQ